VYGEHGRAFRDDFFEVSEKGATGGRGPVLNFDWRKKRRRIAATALMEIKNFILA
jgi:hypothetical protein